MDTSDGAKYMVVPFVILNIIRWGGGLFHRVAISR